jgi:YVTN family beta-propeller protein
MVSQRFSGVAGKIGYNVVTPTFPSYLGFVMKKLLAALLLALCPLCIFTDQPLRSAPDAKVERHRSPADIAVLPGAQRAVTANQTSDSVSLIDLAAGKVLAEQPCGKQPAGVAGSRDGRRVAVSNFWSGTVNLFEVKGAELVPLTSFRVGAEPRGLAFAHDGGSLYVALAGMNEVVQVEWPTGKRLRSWPAPAEPRRIALTSDGRFLAAISSRTSQVRCWDTRTGKQVWERTIMNAINLHGLAVSPSNKEFVTTHIHDRHHAIVKPNIEQGWALDNRLTRLTVVADPRDDYWQIGLDVRAKAVADPCAAAFSARGDWLVVAAAGTHELLLFKADAVPWNAGDPGDFLDSSLDQDDGRLRRLPLGGRPLAVQFVDDRPLAVVANYLLDAVQVVDVKAGKLVSTIPLGGPAQPALARKGEAIFYDAQRSHHQWFSCHSCHPDGHTCSVLFDTLNDDSHGNPKLTPTLRGVGHTAPYTWHGWQNKLGDAVEKSLTETLWGKQPTKEDVSAVVAFMETLDHPPNPNRQADGALSAAALRGQAVFKGKAHCARCHQGEHYTSTKNYDVKVDPDGSPFDLWNPPSLRGLYDRGPYMHDGRAETLDELLKLHHVPEKLGGEKLTPEERKDLIEFLMTL